ncbi:MAG: hypothetical protein IJ367_00585, partial [Clostridia bacterium]|nr:hypothetical protein [Clostridia bacterium]
MNFVANFMLVYRFNHLDWALSHCIAFLQKNPKEAMPKNLLELSYALLRKQDAPPSFRKAFTYYVRNKESFTECSDELINRYLEFTCTHSELTPLAAEIFKQINNLDLFFRQYLTTQQTIREDVFHALGLDSLVSLILHYLQHTKEITPEQANLLTQLLDYAKNTAESTRQKTVLLWLDEMVEQIQEKHIDSYYFQVSFYLLQQYPAQNWNDFSKYDGPLPLAEYCNLLDRWLEINATYLNARGLYTYYIRVPLPKNEQERQLHFRYLSNAVTKMYEKEDPERTPPEKMLRTKKSLLSLYFLNNFYHDSCRQMTKDDWSNLFGDPIPAAELVPFSDALEQLWNTDSPHSFRDSLITCGMTNYWDDFLMELATTGFDRSLCFREAVTHYVSHRETYKLNRRILQMLVLATSANRFEQNEETESFYAVSNEITVFRNLAKNGVLNRDFFENLIAISKMSGNRMCDIIKSFLAMSQEQLQELLPQMEQFLTNKRFDAMLPSLLSILSQPFADTMIRLFFVLQEPNYIQNVLTKRLMEQPEKQSTELLQLLCHPVFQEGAGSFFGAFLPALYYYGHQNPELAKQTMPAKELCPPEYKNQ